MEILAIWSMSDYAGLIFFCIALVIGLFLFLSKYDIFFAGSAHVNQAIFIMKGSKPNGQYSRLVLLSNDTGYDPETDRFLYNTKGETGYSGLTIAGRPFIGTPGIHYVYDRKMIWQEVQEGSKEPWLREENTKYLFVKPTDYLIKVEDAEDKDRFPLDLIISTNVRPYYGYHTIFGIEDWHRNHRELVTQAVNNVVGKYTFEQLKSEIDTVSDDSSTDHMKDSFSDAVMRELKRKKGKESYLFLTGHEVLRIVLRQIDPDASHPANREAASAKAIAKLKAEALAEEAMGIAKATEIKAEGNAKATRIEGTAKKEVEVMLYGTYAKDKLSAHVRRSDAIEKHKGTLALDSDTALLLGDRNSEEEGGQS